MVTTENSGKATLDVNLKVRPIATTGRPTFTGLFIFVGMLTLGTAALFVGVICFYQRRERYLRRIYTNIKQRSLQPSNNRMASV